MRPSVHTRHIAAAALAVGLVVAWGVPATADPGDETAPGYPTWAEVEAARGNQQTAQAEYQRLEGVLQQAQAAAATTSAKALTATDAADQADRDLADATAREQAIATQLAQAQQAVTTSHQSLGQMASWLYRNGSGWSTYGRVLSAKDPEQLMEQLTTVEQATDSWRQKSRDATAAADAVTSLHRQAGVAAQARQKLADRADAAARTAQRARDQAAAAVATATANTDTLYAQLAVLQGTTAEVERRYQIGVQVAATLREQEQAREQAAAQQARSSSSDSSSGAAPTGSAASSGSGSSGSSGGGDVVVDPAGAQAYAHGAIGAYGWGDDQFSCLVSLWNGESGWRADATNPFSGAYGIPQSLPPEKMSSAGADWRTNGDTQVDWGLAYISRAYGSPCTAWNTWLSRDPHWY